MGNGAKGILGRGKEQSIEKETGGEGWKMLETETLEIKVPRFLENGAIIDTENGPMSSFRGM